MGVLMVVTGRPDAGLDLLARETERLHHHPYWYAVFRSDELLRSVRNDPRFQAILAHERAYSAEQRALPRANATNRGRSLPRGDKHRPKPRLTSPQTATEALHASFTFPWVVFDLPSCSGESMS